MDEFRSLTEFLDGLAENSDPGNECIVKVGHREVYRHTAGYADIESKRPVGDGDLYMMWSVSKIFTCTAFMTLVENGVVSLDDPVEKYIPEFGSMMRADRQTGELVPASKKMKVYHLITMTSGLSYDAGMPALQALRRDPGHKCPTVPAVRAIATQPLSFEPGDEWLYGLSHDVLAGVAEVASGMPFYKFVKEKIFDPLGMKDSTFRMSTIKDKRLLSTQYRWDGQTGKRIRTNNTNGFVFGDEYDSGGAGLVTTARDCSIFADAMACGGVGENGARILKAETIDEMRKNRLDEKLIKTKGFREFHHLTGYGYGLGVRTMIEPDAVAGYAVPGEFGWDGAAGSCLIIDPENRVSLVYARHMLDGEQYLNELRPRMYEGLINAGLIEKKKY